MACMKSILFVSLLLAAVSVKAFPALTSDDHNIYQCPDPSLAQKKILDITIHEKGHFLRILQKSIQFPSNGNINKDKITCLQILNLVQDGTGGYPSIFDGGLDEYEITVNLRSQRGRGLDFRIILWTGTSNTPQPSTSKSTSQPPSTSSSITAAPSTPKSTSQPPSTSA